MWFDSTSPTVGGLRESEPLTSTPHDAMGIQGANNDMYGGADVSPGEHFMPPAGRDGGHVSVDVLSDLVKKIGTSIGENIVSCLKSISANEASVARSSVADLSKVNLTVSHQSYEPHPFRGDGTDRLSISEWEGSVRVYLARRGVELCEQAGEVLNKLQGRASDVVRVGLRCRPSLNLQLGPEPVFDILKQHFSDSVTSFMPLADFYDTKPF